MLEVLIFIFNCIINFIKMLFTIDVGFTNLGTLMCIVYILLPVILIIVDFIKKQLVEEFDDYYDNERYIVKHQKRYRGKHEKR